jgi:hypothetical protein
MEINRPDVLAEVTAKFLEYEGAINQNDVGTLDSAFLDSPQTVRFGMTEELWSYDEIKAFRRTRNTAGTPRELIKYAITTYGDSLAVANALFRREAVGKLGRQSQTWLKLDGAWKVISAHVSLREVR